MSATYEEAIDQMSALFKDAWNPSYPVDWPNIKFDRPAPSNDTSSTFWARFRIMHAAGGQGSLQNSVGARMYDRTGNIIIQVFGPIGVGTKPIVSLAKVAAGAYEGTTTLGGIWFKRQRVQEMGPEDAWYRVDAKVDFEYVEVK